MLGLGQDDAIDQDARDLDVARIERSLGRNALDLRDDDSARVASGDGEREVLERQLFALGSDVAVRIGRRAAD